MSTAKDPSRALEGLYVLVVEDDDDSRTILTTVLRYYGAHVVATASADAALHRLKVFRPHVVLTDIAMPRHDGLWLLREMRDVPGRADICVIAITALDEADGLKPHGFDAVLTKPVNPQVLYQAIRRVRALD
jgi:CheY-like chemotaxis protein